MPKSNSKLVVIPQHQVPTTTKEKLIIRNVARESFQLEHGGFSGNTLGSPGRPRDLVVKGGTYEHIADDTQVARIIEDIEETKKKDGVVCIANLLLSNIEILDALKNARVCAVVQKDTFSVPVLRRYIKLTCYVRRSEMPGNILPHLYRQDRQDDFGMMEAVRMVGNIYSTPRLRRNERRPWEHDKVIVHLHPDSEGRLRPKIGVSGSLNLSDNAGNNFDSITRFTHQKSADFYFQVFAHMYSKSEGLYNPSHGLQPTYNYDFLGGKNLKFGTPPPCPNPKCRSLTLPAPIWVPAGDADYAGAHRHLKCPACGDDSRVYLKEFVAVY